MPELKANRQGQDKMEALRSILRLSGVLTTSKIGPVSVWCWVLPGRLTNTAVALKPTCRLKYEHSRRKADPGSATHQEGQ